MNKKQESELLFHGDGITFSKSEVYCSNRSVWKVGNPGHIVAKCLTCEPDNKSISEATRIKLTRHGYCPCCGGPINDHQDTG